MNYEKYKECVGYPPWDIKYMMNYEDLSPKERNAWCESAIFVKFGIREYEEIYNIAHKN